MASVRSVLTSVTHGGTHKKVRLGKTRGLGVELSTGSWNASLCSIHLCFELEGTNLEPFHSVGSTNHAEVRI